MSVLPSAPRGSWLTTSRRVPLARKSLFEDRRRAGLALLGVSGGLLLVLVMSALFAGFTHQATAYFDRSPADVVVSQAGVRSMQMSTSSLPAGTIDEVRHQPGVAWVESLRQANTTITRPGSVTLISYVFGYDVRTGRGGPQHLSTGRPPRNGEIVIDAAGAEQLGVGVGDQVQVFGHGVEVSGLTTGLTSLGNTNAFMTSDTYALLAGPGTNYLLVGASPQTTAARLAARLAHDVPAVTVQSRAAFSAENAALVGDLYGDVIKTMRAIGFVIALALVALTLSAITTSNLREYAVVQALGATRARLAGVIVLQALWAIVVATAMATVLALLLSRSVGVLAPNVELVVEPGAVLSTLLGALAVGAPAALLPLRRVLSVDPATAYRTSS